MILLSSRRKTKRDEEAGIVFSWRHRDSTFWTSFFALLVTSAAVVFCGYALRIPLLEESGLKERRGTGVAMRLFAEKAVDDGERDTLEEVLAVISLQTRYSPPREQALREFPETEKSIDLPHLVDGKSMNLPEIAGGERSQRSLPVLGTYEPFCELSSAGNLQDRVQGLLAFPTDGDVSPGQEVRCKLSLNEDGRVTSLWILETGDERLSEKVQAWLPRQNFLPSKALVEWGELVFTVKAK